MPAVDPARLRTQVAELSLQFSKPDAYLRELLALFEFYADRTRRPSDASRSAPIIHTYRVAEPVLRRISLAAGELARTDGAAGLALADTLWGKPVFECRLLAAQVLGEIESEPPAEIATRLQRWGIENEEEQLLNALGDDATRTLRSAHRQVFTVMVEEWLGHERVRVQRLGLRAIRALLDEIAFEHLPGIYRMLGEIMRTPRQELRPDLLGLIADLAERSPQETAYFLRQQLVQTTHKNLAWVIKHSLAAFPEAQQTSLKEVLKG